MKIFDLKNDNNINDLIYSAKCIKNGELVIFPTETVYGLGACALNSNAVSSIFIAKGRTQDNPLIVHISDFDMLKSLVCEPSDMEKKLIDAFMPGPFTLILKKRDIIPNNVSANLNTVGIRMPSNKIANKFISLAGPIAAPSANISSRPSGTNINDIKEEFKDKVSVIIDGGDSDIGLESTVVKVINEVPTILRPGKITPNDIKSVVGIVKIDDNVFKKATGIVECPGMKYKHYAPNSKCLLLYSDNSNDIINYINHLSSNNIVIGSSKLKECKCSKFLYYGDTNEEISHNIFRLLRSVDQYMPDLVIIEGVKKEELGIAIMNRLIRTVSFNYKEL